MISDHDARRALMYCGKIAPFYLEGLYRAAIDGAISIGLVIPGGAEIRFESDLPQVVIVSDDIERARGPAAFNPKTLGPLIRRCAAASVISVPPERGFYDNALNCALQYRTDVLVIETRSEQEVAWIQHLVEVNPDIVWGTWTDRSTQVPQ